jgi:transposase
MPTVPRRPAAQRERERLEARRLRAAKLFATGARQAEVAGQLGVSGQAVSVWHARWQAGGTQALRSKGPSGPAPRLYDMQLAEVEQALLKGAGAHGFVGELWTLEGTVASAATASKRRDCRHENPAALALLPLRGPPSPASASRPT